MVNQSDVQVIDSVLLEEIELLTELVIAATLSVKPLSVREIDEFLGVGGPLIPHSRPLRRQSNAHRHQPASLFGGTTLSPGRGCGCSTIAAFAAPVLSASSGSAV